MNGHGGDGVGGLRRVSFRGGPNSRLPGPSSLVFCLWYPVFRFILRLSGDDPAGRPRPTPALCPNFFAEPAISAVSLPGFLFFALDLTNLSHKVVPGPTISDGAQVGPGPHLDSTGVRQCSRSRCTSSVLG